MNKKIKIASLVVVIIVAILIVILSNQSQSEKKKTIKVGFISSLSGDAGVWGQSLEKGFRFALEEINSRGGIKNRKIEAIYEDDQCEATAGINAFNKVIDMDKTKIITGTVCSSVAMAAAKKVEGNKVLYIASGATNPEVPKQGEYIFRIWPSDAYEAKESGKAAVKILNLKSFGIAYINDNPAGLALADNFREATESVGAKTLAIESYSSKEKDFKTQLLKLTSKNPDGLYLVALPEQTPVIIEQARQLKFNKPIFVYGVAITAQGIIEKISNTENIFYSQNKELKETEFWKNYKLKTGEEADSLVALGYDSLKIIETGLEKCGEDTDCIKDYYLNSLGEYQSARGKFSFDKDGDISGGEYQLMAIKNGKNEVYLPN